MTMDTVTLGSFILDDIYEFPPVRQPIYGIVGGAGTYAAIAARTFNGKERSQQVGLIVHEGTDFPAAVRKQIEALDMHVRFIKRTGSKTTRGSNVYDAQGNRQFAFVVPNVKIYASMMDEIHLTSRIYHMICTPTRCIDLCNEILTAREKQTIRDPGLFGHQLKKPIFVWEPMEDSCQPSEMALFREAFTHVDVFSPNQRELLALCGMEGRPGPDLDLDTIAAACHELLQGCESRVVVARCGPHGCVVVQVGRCFHVPAYHQPHKDLEDLEDLEDLGIPKYANPVVDVTGGGNAFLGGFSAAYSSGFDVPDLTKFEAAAFWGNVAASYAIEQVGVPQLTATGGKELWNGTSPIARLSELIHRFKCEPE